MGEKVKARAVKRKKKKSVRKCPLASSGGCLVSSLFVPSLCSLSLSLLTSRFIPVVPAASPPVRETPRRDACLAALLVATH
jgi:hypothetical protein